MTTTTAAIAATATFTQSQLDAMVRDADTAAKRVLGDSTLADVCVHVKALAAEVKELRGKVQCCERDHNYDGDCDRHPNGLRGEVERLQRSLIDTEQVRDRRWQMAKDAGNEVVKLRDTIRRAGFEVCQTSGDWTIHDVSNLAALDEARTTEVISRNIDLEIENELLKSELAVDAEIMPCGHAKHWQAARNPVNKQSERYCLFCEVERLQSIVGTLPKREDGVPITPNMKIWFQRSPNHGWEVTAEMVGEYHDSDREWHCIDFDSDGRRDFASREAALKARSTQ